MSDDLLAQQSWREQMSARTGGRPEGLIAVCDAFLEEVPQLVERIQKSVAHQDPDNLKRASHTLRSCLSYVAPEEDVAAAAAIEENSGEPASISADQLTSIDAISQRWILCVRTLRAETAQRLDEPS